MYKQQLYPLKINLFMTQLKYKSDIAFYKAFKSAQKQHYSQTTFHLFASLEFFLLFMMIDYYPVSGQTCLVVRNSFVLRFIAHSFLLFLHLAQICQIYGSSNMFMILANETGHALIDQPTINFKSIDQCVSSKVFIVRDLILESALTKPAKYKYINQVKIWLKEVLKGKAMWIKKSYDFGQILIWLPRIYSMNNFFSVDMVEKFVIIAYLFGSVTWILMLVFQIYEHQSRKKAFLPNPFEINLPEKQATSSNKQIAGSQCGICCQDIAQKDKLFVMYFTRAACKNGPISAQHALSISMHDIPMEVGFSQFVQL